MRDVAKVELGQQEDRFRARYRGRPAVPLGIVKQATANPLEISEALKKMLPEIQRTLPAGMKVEIAYDMPGIESSARPGDRGRIYLIQDDGNYDAVAVRGRSQDDRAQFEVCCTGDCLKLVRSSPRRR